MYSWEILTTTKFQNPIGKTILVCRGKGFTIYLPTCVYVSEKNTFKKASISRGSSGVIFILVTKGAIGKLQLQSFGCNQKSFICHHNLFKNRTHKTSNYWKWSKKKIADKFLEARVSSTCRDNSWLAYWAEPNEHYLDHIS